MNLDQSSFISSNDSIIITVNRQNQPKKRIKIGLSQSLQNLRTKLLLQDSQELFIFDDGSLIDKENEGDFKISEVIQPNQPSLTMTSLTATSSIDGQNSSFESFLDNSISSDYQHQPYKNNNLKTSQSSSTLPSKIFVEESRPKISSIQSESELIKRNYSQHQDIVDSQSKNHYEKAQRKMEIDDAAKIYNEEQVNKQFEAQNLFMKQFEDLMSQKLIQFENERKEFEKEKERMRIDSENQRIEQEQNKRNQELIELKNQIKLQEEARKIAEEEAEKQKLYLEQIRIEKEKDQYNLMKQQQEERLQMIERENQLLKEKQEQQLKLEEEDRIRKLAYKAEQEEARKREQELQAQRQAQQKEDDLLKRYFITNDQKCYSHQDVFHFKQILIRELEKIAKDIDVCLDLNKKAIDDLWNKIAEKGTIEPIERLQEDIERKKRKTYQKKVEENHQLNEVVQLIPVVENSIELRNKQKRKQTLPHYKILLIGKTGAGKSTAINMLVNLVMKREYNDERLIAISQLVGVINKNGEEIKKDLKCNIESYAEKQSDILQSSSQSQTTDCNMYTLETNEFILTLVDTPGLGDTQGTDADKRHIQTIVSRVQRLIEINAIIYVHRSSDCRMDLFLQYYINTLKGMLTKSCQDNFIVLFTSTINPTKIDALKVLNEIGIPCTNYVYFENDCLTPPNYMQGIFEDKKFQEYKHMASSFWQCNQKQYEELISIIKLMKPQQANELLKLLVKRESIYKIAFDKSRQVKQMGEQQIHLNQQLNGYEQVLYELENAPSSTSVVKIVKFRKVEVSVTKVREVNVNQKITYCHQCLSKCHNPCRLGEVYSKGSYQIRSCAAFNGDTCNNCKHSYEYHGHTSTIQEEYQVKELRDEAYTVEETVTDQNKVQLEKSRIDSKETLAKKIEESNKEIKNIQGDIDDDLKVITLLDLEVKKESMSCNDSILIKYIESQIESVEKNSKITAEQRKVMITSYKQQLDNYNLISQQTNSKIDFMKSDQIYTLAQEKLKQTEEQLMKSVQTGIQQTIIPQDQKKSVLQKIGAHCKKVIGYVYK